MPAAKGHSSRRRDVAASVLAVMLAVMPGCMQTAELVVVNAAIWTGDESRPAAEALAVRDGRFLAVGGGPEISRHIGPTTAVIDAGGRRVLPGLADAHTHVLSAGLMLSRLQLRDAPDRGAFVAAVRDYAASLPSDAWVLGGRWSTESWPDPTQPVKEWIDPVTGDRPAYLVRMDGHQALVNSAALKLAGIDRHGPADPAGGRIDRHPRTGEPTGILRDEAMTLVARLIPVPSEEQKDKALLAAMREANRYGVTMIHDMSNEDDLPTFARAHRAGALTVRLCVFVSVDDWSSRIGAVRAFPVADDWLRIAGFKGYMDGSLGSRTAYMREPYADNPRESPQRRGLLMPLASQEGELLRQCRAIVEAGLRPAVHAIGDEANHRLLDAYAELVRNGGQATIRPRMEHAQHLLPGDIPRLPELGVIASMQPFHKADDGRYAEQAIGRARCETSYAFRSLLEAGAHLAFGSDWPVVTVNPFAGVATAVTGHTLDGGTWMRHQNISVEQALAAYTSGPAYAAGMEDRLGRIRPGYLADFVILQDDPFAVRPERLDEVGVFKTIVAGKIVFDAGPQQCGPSVHTPRDRL